MNPNRNRLVTFLSAVFIAASAHGQADNPAETPPKSDEVIELSPFVVSSDKDLGYLAANTLSGSRLNTKLYDTSASISEMTKEFLDDIGAENTMDAVQYALGFDDDQPGANDNTSQFNSQRVVARGVGRSGTVSRDFFPWNLSSDTFSTERLSLSRGPNSILYGMGNAGGIINSMSKRANFKTNTQLNLKTDEEGSWRAHVDHNQRLTDTLALRVNLLGEDKKTWREKEYTKSQRIQMAGTWRPTRKTEVRVDFERGLQDRLIGLRFSGRDMFLQWLNAGSPAYDRLVNGNTYPAGTQSWGATPHLTYDGDSTQWFNYQRFAQTRGIGNSVANGDKLLNEDYLPFSVLLGGPAATTNNSYWTGTLIVQQQLLKNLYIEVGVNKQNDQREVRRTMVHSAIGIKMDPNKTLPGGILNPNYGEMFIEGQAVRNTTDNDNLNKRVSLTYEWDSQRQWLGRHRWLALATQEDSDGYGVQWNESNLTPLNPAVPAYSNAQNTIFRRTYLDFNGGNRYFNQDPFSAQQAAVNFSDPANGLAGTITPGFYRSNLNPTEAVNKSAMIAGQSQFWNDRFILTYGYRKDEAERRASSPVRNTVTQEIVDFTWDDPTHYKGSTRTLGAVFHLTSWLSVYGNRSDNFTPQNGIDINGDNIGNVRGDGQDFGLKFRVGDGKIYGRVGYYKTGVLSQTGRQFETLIAIQQIWTAIEGATGPHAVKFQGAPALNTDTQDFDVDGLEFEVVANPVKGLALTLNYATLEGVATNLFPITRAHIAENRALWEANTALPVTGGTVADNLAEIDSRMTQVDLQEGRQGTGTYAKSFNAFGRYQFQSEALKRWSLGAGARFRADRILGYKSTLEPVYSPKWFMVDASLGYRRPIFNKRVQMRLQLNVQNLLDNRDLIWNGIRPATGEKIDYTLFTPRMVSLTGSFEF